MCDCELESISEETTRMTEDNNIRLGMIIMCLFMVRNHLEDPGVDGRIILK
jgi:hypothetical protein